MHVSFHIFFYFLLYWRLDNLGLLRLCYVLANQGYSLFRMSLFMVVSFFIEKISSYLLSRCMRV